MSLSVSKTIGMKFPRAIDRVCTLLEDSYYAAAIASIYGFWNFSSKEPEDLLRYIEALFFDLQAQGATTVGAASVSLSKGLGEPVACR